MAKYLVNRKFVLGAFGVSLDAGQTVEFDGTTLNVGTTPYQCPQFSAAVREGWASLVEGVPPVANKPTLAAQASAPKKESKPRRIVNGFEVREEGATVVTTVSSVVEKRQQLAKAAASSLAKEPAGKPAPLAKRMQVIPENQESTVIAKIKPPRLDGKGEATDQARIEWVNAPLPKKAAPAPEVDDEEPEEDIDLGLDDIPQPLKAVPETVQVADRVTQVVSNWDKKAHYQFRVKEAVETYGSDPEVLNAILEIESPGVVSMIRKKLNR